jgi:lipopolysaccharide export system protein LptA
MAWQKRARLAAAAFGVATAAGVYVSLQDRQPPRVPADLPRLEPRAVAASVGGWLEQVPDARRDFVIRFARTVTYDDGSTRLIDVHIEVNRNGRTFVVTAREARESENKRDLDLRGDVVLRDSDGFELRTEQGVYDREEGTVRATGAITFSKGRMSGSGQGMTYAEHDDVLRIAARAHVTVEAAAHAEPGDEEAAPGMEFSAESATLDRRRHVLTLDRRVHVVNGDQVIDTDLAHAQLSEADDVVRFVQLRGQALVRGGPGPLESMSAREIDLDYSDDGQALEGTVLRGGAAMAIRSGGEGAARRFTGERLDAALAPSGALARLTGAGGVEMALPAAATAPARRITAESFEASGAEEGELSEARFTDRVEFREAVSAGAGRLVRSRALTLSMTGEAVARAHFAGEVTFEEEDLTASAAEAHYRPDDGVFTLAGRDARGDPRITDGHVAVEAPSIDVTLQDRRIEAGGGVKTVLRAAGKAPGTGNAAGRGRLPGLLQQDADATVIADALQYTGSTGRALFTGRARLWQGDTDIRGDAIDLQQQEGNLTARGSARSTIVFDTGRSDGSGDEIRYVDATRVIRYVARPAPGAEGEAATARLTGPQGDLRGAQIEVRLAAARGQVERVDARGAVSATVNGRVMRGDTLAYEADTESYQMAGSRAAPVTVEISCSVMTGMALTYSRSTDTMSIDGQKDFRTLTTRRSPCGPPTSR